MAEDPIIEEVRRTKEEIAAKFNHDVHSIAEHLREVKRKYYLSFNRFFRSNNR